MHRHLHASLLAGSLWLIVAPAGAQQAPRTTRVTLELKAVPTRAALEKLFQDSGRRYAVDPSLPDVPASLSVIDVQFTVGLRALIGLTRATYRIEGGVYVIGPRGTVPGEKTWTLDFRGTPLRQALQAVADQSRVHYAVEPDVPNVPIYFHLKTHDPGHEAWLLADLAGATATGGSENLHIAKNKPMDRDSQAAKQAPWEWLRKRISMHVEAVPPREALAIELQAAGKRYRIAPDLPDGLITVSARDVDFVTVLESVARISGAEFAREGESYVIRRAR